MRFFSFLIIFIPFLLHGQNEDSLFIRNIYDQALTQGECYENLRSLCKDVGHRLSGSKGAEKAVVWGEKLLRSYGFDTVFLQEIEVPRWERGDICHAAILEDDNKIALNVLALGGSVGTSGVIKAPVIVVDSYQELQRLGRSQIEGKVVFFKQAMDPKYIDTFRAYGSCATFRVRGASRAAQLGAKAVIVRSLTHAHDHHPHTGVMIYEDSIPKIPGFALSTVHSDELVKMVESGEQVIVTLESNCRTLSSVKSYNVIAQLNASEPTNKYIAFGGHLDSWDVGEGAHDDGAGVVHSIEALRLLKGMGYSSKYNLRCVLFMNEENGNNGGKTYAIEAAKNGEIHVAALESDRGGFSPRGFSVDAEPAQFEQLNKWKNLLEPYQLHLMYRGGSGVDISPLRKTMNNKVVLVGLVPDSQRYFDVHHAAADVFETVNKRELELGAAAVASLVYLMDRYLNEAYGQIPKPSQPR